MNTHFKNCGCHSDITSTGVHKAITSGKPIDVDAAVQPVRVTFGQEFDLNSGSKNATLGIMRICRGLAAVCGRVMLGFWAVSALLVAGPQAFAAPVEVTDFGSNPAISGCSSISRVDFQLRRRWLWS